MYPSGEWVGHWDQNGLGRQDMHDLVIEFDGNTLSGTGWDWVGKFTLSGTIYPDANVEIVKKYVNRHSVVYRGQHDGEGTIFGVWALASDDGTFAIRPAGGFRKTDAPIQEFTP